MPRWRPLPFRISGVLERLAPTHTAAALRYTIAGAGSGIGGTSDSFSYASTTSTGNIELIGKVATQTGTSLSPYATAGFMLRAAPTGTQTADKTANAFVSVSPRNGVNFTTRTSYGATSSTTLGPSLVVPVWVRLVVSQTSVAAF